MRSNLIYITNFNHIVTAYHKDFLTLHYISLNSSINSLLKYTSTGLNGCRTAFCCWNLIIFSPLLLNKWTTSSSSFFKENIQVYFRIYVIISNNHKKWVKVHKIFNFRLNQTLLKRNSISFFDHCQFIIYVVCL